MINMLYMRYCYVYNLCVCVCMYARIKEKTEADIVFRKLTIIIIILFDQFSWPIVTGLPLSPSDSKST